MAGCRGEGERQAGNGDGNQEVRVAAAANMKFAFDEVAAEFQKMYPQIKVTVTYGASGNFFAQLCNKAPFDVFLSADEDYPRELIGKGLAAENSQFVYAVGKIVVWVPNNSPLDLNMLGIRAVADPAVRKVAIANPRHAPYGRAAESAMKKLGVYEQVKDRLVLGDNVEQVAHFLHIGATDIGIVPLSLALAPAMREKGRYWVVPTDAYPPLAQAGVILSWAEDNEGAVSLRAFLTGTQGREVLERHGYDFPKE
ncbi:MAG TPA: molybdate ABC transporter substrate-binding protein [Gemmataceae bacterium]|nr:molybdate ABC transporter substrate-binding protein [Gemmataceae bacterium]